MFPVKKVLLAAALTVTMGGMGLSPAKAATETWNFNSPTGALGTTQNYASTPGGLIATAAGFLSGAANPNTAGAFGTPGNLFGKNDPISNGSIETGLGMLSPPGGTDNEITAGVSFIRVSLPTGLTGATAFINSVTDNEHYEIFGSTSATSGYVLVVANGATQGTAQLLQTAACPLCTFFAFFAVGTDNVTGLAANILLGSITAQTSVVPLPGALVLFGSGLVGLAALGRRKRKQLEATAA